jgi:serine/threonine protein kinase
MGPSDLLYRGQLFDRYRIEGAIGDGGMGRVYRAYDTKLERLVALKVLKPNPADDATARRNAEARLLAEGRAAAKLSSPHVVRIFDAGTFEGLPFLSMELVRGKTLRERGSSPLNQRISWLRDVALGLAAAHGEDLVHRDIKPDNVMVREDGRAVVLDFGIARATGDASSATTQLLGTVPYMAPEQILGASLDGRTDQFAWGAMAYELLSDTKPWGETRQPMKIVHAILQVQPPWLSAIAPQVSECLAAVVARAMAKDPDDRFSSMVELLSLLGDSEERPIAVGTGALAYHSTPMTEITTRTTDDLARALADAVIPSPPVLTSRAGPLLASSQARKAA